MQVFNNKLLLVRHKVKRGVGRGGGGSKVLKGTGRIRARKRGRIRGSKRGKKRGIRQQTVGEKRKA